MLTLLSIAGTEPITLAEAKWPHAWADPRRPPDVAQNLTRNGGRAIDSRTTRPEGDEISQRKSKCFEKCSGWAKTVGQMQQVMVRELSNVNQQFTLTMTLHASMRSQRPGCKHITIVVGARKPRDLSEFTWINTFIGNLKTSLCGTFHAFAFSKYATSYFGAFSYRFNRRF